MSFPMNISIVEKQAVWTLFSRRLGLGAAKSDLSDKIIWPVNEILVKCEKKNIKSASRWFFIEEHMQDGGGSQ